MREPYARGAVTIDGGNDDGAPSDAAFVFITGTGGTTLTTASDSEVVLTEGTQACDVFWQVGSSATFGSDTAFVGTVMALTAISAGDGATFEGRLLARSAGVTLINNTITRPGCEETAADADTSGSATDGSDTIAGSGGGGGSTTTANPGLPDTGGPEAWAALAGALSLLVGTVITRRFRYRPTHAA